MTKKDYIAVAKLLNREWLGSTTPSAKKAVQRVVESMAAFFLSDNPRFDQERFHAACFEGLVRERAGTQQRPI